MSDSSLPFSVPKSTSFVEEDEWDQFADAADGAFALLNEGSSIAFQEEINFKIEYLFFSA